MNKFTVTQIQRNEVYPLTLKATCLQGYMNASYEELVQVFGEPTFDTPSGDGKTDIEWLLKIHDNEFDEDHVVTIYNWKDYDGGLAARSNPNYEWHIGGCKKIVVGMLIEYFRDALANEDYDGQPTEYEEWQDYMGGDDWDHGQYDN